MSGAAYARLVPKIHRSKKLPKIDRPWRPKMIAWAGPAAFYPNRFYEQDKWYKARIDKPEKIPKLHIIDPADHMHSIADVLRKEEFEPVNIGFKAAPVKIEVPKTDEERAVLEKKARKMELLVDTSILPCDSTLSIFHHYNVFEDLFGQGIYFENTQKLDVAFGDNAVYNGNVVAPSDMTAVPQVSIESVGSGGFNTLMMVNLDGNPFETSGQLVHWIVANIPDGEDVAKGKQIAPYVQPLPFHGTGYHRIVFLLFRHDLPVELTNMESLSSRVMNMSSFYKKNETTLTPSAVSFVQTTHDASVKQQLHSIGVKAPIYEYEYTEALRPAQKEFPQKSQPFDLYMDMFRDPKEVEAELLEQRLQKAQLDDFQAPKWLDPDYNENRRRLPSWEHRRLLARDGRHAALYDNAIRE